MALVEISNLSKVYESHLAHRALDNLRLEVESGEFVGIMGPSGSGKTTLLKLLCGLMRPDSGQIRYRGQELADVMRSMNADRAAVLRHLVLPGILPGILFFECVFAAIKNRPCHSRWIFASQEAYYDTSPYILLQN